MENWFGQQGQRRISGWYFSGIIALLLFSAVLSAQGVLYKPVNLPQDLAEKFSRYTHYTMEDGLSNNSVSAFLQDDDGFLWCATIDGLNRFDGERFTSFYHQPDGTGLPGNEIFDIILLPDYRILIATTKGLAVLQYHEMVFSPVYLPVRADTKEADRKITKILRDHAGNIWVGTRTGVHILDHNLHVKASYFKPGAVDITYIIDFMELPEGNVIFKTYGNTQWLTINFQKQQPEPLAVTLPQYKSLDEIPLNMTCMTTSNAVYFGNLGNKSKGLFHRFDCATKETKVLLYSDKPKTQLPLQQLFRPFILSDSLILLHRYFGNLIAYNTRNGAVYELPVWPTSYPDGQGVSMFTDKDGALWLGPRYDGIYFLPMKSLPVRRLSAVNTLHEKEMHQHGVSGEWFGFFTQKIRDKWLFGSPNGGFYKTTAQSENVIPLFDFKERAYILGMAGYNGDTIWVNSFNGLYWMDTKTNATGDLKKLFPQMAPMSEKFICRDHYGLIWGRVTNNGVCYFDTRDRTFHHFPSQGADAPFPITSASCTAEDKEGNMWFSFGTEQKYFVKWNRKTGVFEKIEPINPPDEVCTATQFILPDFNGNLWISKDWSVYVMNIATRKIRPFNKSDGLGSDLPEGLSIDKNGCLWFGTAYGLTRYDPAAGSSRTFYVNDGLLSNSIRSVALLDTSNNILLVATSKGLCLFEPDKIGNVPPPPEAHIMSLWLAGKPQPLPASGHWDLAYNQNDISIDYTGINFYNGKKNQYQYRLDAADDDWINAGTSKTATYLNLPPGKYTFQVRAANIDGVWNDRVTTLAITIFPPFWATWTFRISLLIFLAGASWWLYQRQIRMVQVREGEKTQVQKQLADLEMKALRSQMNPHFVFNALNSVQNFILKNDTREASRYLTKFARLMRLILENSESPVVTLAKEIELLKHYTELEALRFNHRFGFDFIIDESLNPESFAIPGMLIQPHIENAIWHGLMHKTELGHLWVRFIKSGDKMITCEIEDNGIGRSKAAAMDANRHADHRSTGLTNIQTRLELLNAQLANDIRLDIEDLYDDQMNPTGTKVIVRMPTISTDRDFSHI